jgi:hypothetical protein
MYAAARGSGLFPAEDAEGNQIDHYQPCGHNAQLGTDLRQMRTFGGDQASTVNYRAQRQVGGNVLQPMRHQKAWEERTAQEHHGEYYDVSQRRSLTFVLGPATDRQADT